jgi:hypothetical protein
MEFSSATRDSVAGRAIVTARIKVGQLKRIMRAFVVAIATFVALAIPANGSAINQATSEMRNPFGVMLGVFQENRAQVIDALNAAYYRTDPSITLTTWNGDCAICDEAKALRLGLVLTVNHNRDTAAEEPSTYPQNLDTYRTQMHNVIAAVQPEVVVVENEQDNPFFWAGTPEQYGDMLQITCEEAHALGLKCTDGGILSSTVILMTHQHYLDLGETAKADSYALRVANNDAEYNYIVNPPDPAARAARVAEGLAYLAEYQPAGADYVNFHWYAPDGDALRESVEYIELLAGLPAITNEIGQRNADPAVTIDLMDAALDLEMDYVVWFSLDRDRDLVDVVALTEKDGAMRPTGAAFAELTSERVLGEVDRTISLEAKPKHPRNGRNVTFSGILSNDDECEVNQTVELLRRKGQGEFKLVETILTDAAGAYEFIRKIKKSRHYQTVAVAEDACGRAESEILRVKVK